ncbi:MAG: divalent-cation tolerance protein CutA [Thaumarchaeota archaeon]|nr:MAG: divalent-cation tolerance protein CutA [Nitrososphaerota archaeon]TMP99000.1 MAG: divalent-cation tolerance protein CutA [Nitrososphaerota archaeon]
MAKAAVKRRLPACGGISQVRSIYSWKGTLRDEAEALIIFKTTEEKVPRLRAFLEKEHPYETPEIIEVQVARVNAHYLSRVVESVAV